MRMTYASYMQFLWRCWHEQDMEHLVTMSERKGCHGGETKMVPRQHIRKWCHGNISENDATTTYPKMMPRQHISSGSSWRYRCKRKCDVSGSCKMVGWSWILGSHGTAAWQTRYVQRPLGHGANIWYISYMQGHLIAVVSGCTFEACIFGAERVS